MVTLQLRISGKVQGVWYRASAKDAAISFGVKGKVWNESNGDVGVIAQGEKENVDAFVSWCWQGPPLASVKDVIVQALETEDIYSSFDISK
jgi:acylphosphatase